MATKLKRHADEDQTAAVEDWIGTVERDYQCRVRIVCNAQGAKGRLAVRIEACDIAGDRLVGVRVQRKTSYPSSYATSFMGTILKELIALHRDLEDYEKVCAGQPCSSGRE